MKRFLQLLLVMGILAAAWFGWTRYQWVYGKTANATSESYELLVYPGTSDEALFTQLDSVGLLQNLHALQWVAARMRFDSAQVKPGRYLVEPGISNHAFLSMIRSGRQSPLRLTINMEHSLEEVAGYAASRLMPDSLEMLRYLRDTFLPQSTYTEMDILTLFIPNTYEFYWNTTPEKFVNRMQKEHDAFWSPERTAKREALNLSEREVYTLASIVEKETVFDEEKPVIAGVYLNRLERGMLLQADPTVVFAIGEPGLTRVLFRHLEIDSPYNTYLYAGLPPGPICMPGLKSLNAVLNPREHGYLYFCANPGNPGKHAFAETLAGHQRNARAYQEWLNRNPVN